MKIAVPLAEKKLSMHFGHCDEFAIFDVDMESKTIQDKQVLKPPRHEPGVLPKWLHDNGAELIISGGMGMRAMQLFESNGIKLIVGATPDEPEKVVQAYLDGTLESGSNVCDH